MRMSVEVEGLDEALRRLKAYDTKSTEKISEAIRLGGQNIGKEARSRVPRRSGKRVKYTHKVRQYGYNIYCPH